MKKLTILACIVALISSCADAIIDVTGDIRGVVKDYSSGQLISNCQVTLTPGGNVKTTDNAGTFEFADLMAGEYVLVFSKAGYTEESKNVTVVGGQASEVSLMLKLKSSFDLSETHLDFGDMESSKSVMIYNNTDSQCSYEISNKPNWLTLNSTQGIVPAEGSASLNIRIDRNSVDYGDYSNDLTINYSGKSSGTVILTVRFKKVKVSKPTVSCSSEAENITETSFDITGKIEATGGKQITSHGHCWSLSPNPTVSDSKTNMGSTQTTGNFKSTITGLTTFTTYYVRAYAENSEGISYSNEITVTTQDTHSDKWDGSAATSFASGSGTAGNPYVIETGAQLSLMRDYSDKHFVLGNNINLDNVNWKPFDFNGTFDGKGYVISNLYIKRSDDYQGLFASLGYYCYENNCCVKNLTIKGVKIEAPNNSYVGAVAGRLCSQEKIPIIQNCKVILSGDSKITGKDYVGGIVGDAFYYYYAAGFYEIPITGCEVNAASSTNLITGNQNVGGISGEGTCEDCIVIAYVKGSENVGGICGFSNGGILARNSFSGKVSGNTSVGGVVGRMEYGSAHACKADAEIDTESGNAGGVVGYVYSYQCNVVSCYATGSLTSSYKSVKNIGGIVGTCDWSIMTVNHCYSAFETQLTNYDGMGYNLYSYDSCSTGAINNYGRGNESGCQNITDFMKNAYSEYASDWNYKNTWTWTGTVNGNSANVSCPRLAWE